LGHRDRDRRLFGEGLVKVEDMRSLVLYGLLYLLLGVGCLVVSSIWLFKRSKSDEEGFWFWRLGFGLPFAALSCALLLAFVLNVLELVHRLAR
jgi:uncharacterized BrkB/YihY/UPF0761 family membrane protein